MHIFRSNGDSESAKLPDFYHENPLDMLAYAEAPNIFLRKEIKIRQPGRGKKTKERERVKRKKSIIIIRISLCEVVTFI